MVGGKVLNINSILKNKPSSKNLSIRKSQYIVLVNDAAHCLGVSCGLVCSFAPWMRPWLRVEPCPDMMSCAWTGVCLHTGHLTLHDFSPAAWHNTLDIFKVQKVPLHCQTCDCLPLYNLQSLWLVHVLHAQFRLQRLMYSLFWKRFLNVFNDAVILGKLDLHSPSFHPSPPSVCLSVFGQGPAVKH